jgi:hypothetical protein
MCKKIKPVSDFYRNRTKPDGKQAHCKKCDEIGRENRRLKSRYNITLDDYNELFEIQNGECAVCGKHQSELKRRLYVDHCHKTGIIRGLLCHRCNSSIGLLFEDLEIIKGIFEYVKKFKD